MQGVKSSQQHVSHVSFVQTVEAVNLPRLLEPALDAAMLLIYLYALLQSLINHITFLLPPFNLPMIRYVTCCCPSVYCV